VRFHWLILTGLSFFFVCLPAHAGKLLFWRFESNQNRLIFTTDQGVQPTAQLIANPTRLVIDLPGTILGKPTINQNLGRVITNLRIGQFDSRTTRLVVELAPGYTLDPQQIKIRGISPTQWTVDLPEPERIISPAPPFPSKESGDLQSRPIAPTRTSTLASNSRVTNNPSSAGGLRVTSNGLIVDIDGGNRHKINVKRSRDRRQIEFELEGITLPPNLSRAWNLNEYGISQVEVTQTSSSPPVARLTLNVTKDSPDWQASFIRTGGLVLWPQGGMNNLAQRGYRPGTTTAQPTVTAAQPTLTEARQPAGNQARIEAIEIHNTQLLIRGDRQLQARGTWNRANSVYEIRLENTELSPQFKSPQLSANSPISRLRIWQPDERTVVILAQPALGVRMEQLNQPGQQIVALPLTRYSSSVSSTPVNSFPNTNSATPLNLTPPRRTWQPTIPARAPRSKTLVVIDPGHGGKDPGAIGLGGIQEKQIVMSISQEIARILEQQGIQVKLTRGSDYFVSLQGRTEMANRIDADLFVSIHANSAGRNKPQVSGLETYYFQSGRYLAETIHRNVLRRVDVGDRRVRQARFYVLRTSDMPAVLVETGFVTGTEDAAKLSNPSYQRQMAEAISAGIVEYIRSNRL
jgi:N-acetylmuramoyl-L-alanine amidase